MTKTKNLKPFKPGQSGNPAGRPKGSRNKLGEDFIAALHADFGKGGIAAIQAVRENDPSTYVRVVAGLLPKELEIKRPEQDLTDEQLATVIEFIESQLAGGTGAAGAGAGSKGGGKQARNVPSVH